METSKKQDNAAVEENGEENMENHIGQILLGAVIATAGIMIMMYAYFGGSLLTAKDKADVVAVQEYVQQYGDRMSSTRR